MIVIMRSAASEADLAAVVDCIRAQGLTAHVSKGAERTVVGVVGDERMFNAAALQRLSGVERAIRVVADWRIISREARPEDAVLTVRGQQLGGGTLVQVPTDALGGFLLPDATSTWAYADPFVSSAGVYAATPECDVAQQGRRLQDWVAQVRRVNAVSMVRLRDVRHLTWALEAGVDVLCIDGCLLGNRGFLREVGCLNVPVVLFKDVHHALDDWLCAAEWVVLQGNHHVALGDAGALWSGGRGRRLDVEAICRAKALCHLPIVADLTALSVPDVGQTQWQALATAAGADMLLLPQVGETLKD